MIMIQLKDINDNILNLFHMLKYHNIDYSLVNYNNPTLILNNDNLDFKGNKIYIKNKNTNVKFECKINYLEAF